MDWFKRRIDTLAPDEYDRCLALMPAGRRAQAERHLRPQNRLATVLGEWMVKTALAERCRIPVEEIRLVINRFNGTLFHETGAYGDLDAVIDGAGVRLLGVVPEDFSLAASFLQGKKARADSPGMKALSRVAGRLEGESIPLAGF